MDQGALTMLIAAGVSLIPPVFAQQLDDPAVKEASSPVRASASPRPPHPDDDTAREAIESGLTKWARAWPNDPYLAGSTAIDGKFAFEDSYAVKGTFAAGVTGKSKRYSYRARFDRDGERYVLARICSNRASSHGDGLECVSTLPTLAERLEEQQQQLRNGTLQNRVKPRPPAVQGRPN